MPRITPVEPAKLIRVFETLGFERKRTRGSHVSMVKPGVARPVVIPLHGDVQVPIILSNLRTAGVSREDYLSLLERL